MVDYRFLVKHKYSEYFRQNDPSSHHLYQIYIGGFKEKLPLKYCKQCLSFFPINIPDHKTSKINKKINQLPT